MQLTINIGYDQIFELVRQLPPGERKRLFRESEFSTAVQQPPELTVSNAEVDQCRQEALRLALECPVATPEEIESQNEYRKQFRCRPT